MAMAIQTAVFLFTAKSWQYYTYENIFMADYFKAVLNKRQCKSPTTNSKKNKLFFYMSDFGWDSLKTPHLMQICFAILLIYIP